MSDLSKEELDRMYEASKSDHNSVVGSDVRQMVGMIRRAADRIEALEAENASFADDSNEAIARIEKLEAALRQIIKAIDAKAVRIDSANIGGGDPEIGYEQHYWHEEWLHYARAVLAPEQDK